MRPNPSGTHVFISKLFMNLRRCVMTNEELMTLVEKIARVALEDQVCSRYIEHELGATTWDLDKAYAYLEAKLNKENKDD
jgi:predicted Rdx family selenoprotein